MDEVGIPNIHRLGRDNLSMDHSCERGKLVRVGGNGYGIRDRRGIPRSMACKEWKSLSRGQPQCRCFGSGVLRGSGGMGLACIPSLLCRLCWWLLDVVGNDGDSRGRCERMGRMAWACVFLGRGLELAWVNEGGVGRHHRTVERS